MSGHLVVNGKKVTPHNEKFWRRLRERDGIDHDFLADPQYIGDFKSGGGKGGDLMAFTRDCAYIIKEVGKGDHEALLRVTASYFERVKDGSSLLCIMYLHYTDESEKSYMVMKNILRHARPWQGLYDLKGCDDDKTLEKNGQKINVVHKRIWHMHMWCGSCTWTDDRMTYFQGKVAARALQILLTAGQRARITRRLKLDTDWLAEEGLMDYSLLVGIKRLTRAEFEADDVARWACSGPDGELRQPMVHVVEPTGEPGPEGAGSGDVMLVYIGIIDFLQSWTFGKKVAMYLKVLERNKATIPPAAYAERFYRHFDNSLRGGAKELDRDTLPGLKASDVKLLGACIDPQMKDEETQDQMRSYYSCRSQVDPRASVASVPPASRLAEAAPRAVASPAPAKAATVAARATPKSPTCLSCFSGLSRS